ncbi:hypothetical protein [Pseudooceanicola sp.]|uniref:nickel/cobalt transporter n=1 Tax=Pseudooceanicola sp. TaxID=1914328 RepID=UPI002613F43D|nr:hypothetical protein [Pseudooceanicola sp.]MDF1855491.1 hypothetical protein [Pseudooceanicola sp.]
MRLAAIATFLGLALLALVLWQYQSTALLWAIERQRGFQTAMAGHLRDLQAGEPRALWAFCLVCAGYGFAHALGPGHGKLVIGGAGLATGATAGRLAGLAIVASLAQAGVAIALVYGGFALFGVNGKQARTMAETWMSPASAALIGVIGVILIYRGWRQWRRLGAARHAPHGHHHGHPHAHSDHDHGHCHHAHGPDLDQVVALRSWRDALALIGAIAIRPCTGAIFVLAIAWPLGIALAGAAGVLAMGLGTAAFTALVAIAGVTLRQSAVLAIPGWAGPTLIALQILAGAAVVWFSALALLR